MAIARMRTAEGIIRELKLLDPNTAVTLSYIRRLIASGKIPVVEAGKKKLVNLDTVLQMLEEGIADPVREIRVMPSIRRVEA